MRLNFFFFSLQTSNLILVSYGELVQSLSLFATENMKYTYMTSVSTATADVWRVEVFISNIGKQVKIQYRYQLHKNELKKSDSSGLLIFRTVQKQKLSH